MKNIPLLFISQLLPLSAEMLSPQIRDTDTDVQEMEHNRLKLHTLLMFSLLCLFHGPEVSFHFSTCTSMPFFLNDCMVSHCSNGL